MSTFHLQVNGGLASRLRVVVGGIAYCEATGRRLHVDWPLIEKSETSGKFPIRFGDIWKYDLEETNGTVIWGGAKNANLDCGGDVRLRTCHIEPFLPYLKRPFRHYVNQLSMQPKTAAMVDSMLPRLKAVLTAGVNIRCAISDPHTKKPDWFWERMEKVQSGSALPMQFFLSTDEKEVSDATKARFLVIERPQTFLYDTEGIRGRAADIYLLDACDWVIGSNHSSYSQFVAMLRGAEYLGSHEKPEGLKGGRYEDAWNEADKAELCKARGSSHSAWVR